MDNVNPSYLTGTKCCGAQCCRLNAAPNEPCWGNVEVADEQECGDGEWYWVHACEGHIDGVDYDYKYKKEEIC